MINLATAGDDRWHLPRHAHIVVFEHDSGNELLTIYDCGAAQSPPSAQFIGHLVNVAAAATLSRTPTGYIADLREPAILEHQAADHWVIRST